MTVVYRRSGMGSVGWEPSKMKNGGAMTLVQRSASGRRSMTDQGGSRWSRNVTGTMTVSTG
ncbi:MAG: hypothetical protein NNA23_03110 [Nitrospira sp.]|nr:hypothetical protein [Nitrospira sp.]